MLSDHEEEYSCFSTFKKSQIVDVRVEVLLPHNELFLNPLKILLINTQKFSADFKRVAKCYTLFYSIGTSQI